jgi:hypothetical protein
VTDLTPHVFKRHTRPEAEYADVNSTDLHLDLAESAFMHWPSPGLADPKNTADQILERIGDLDRVRLREFLLLLATDAYRTAVERQGGDP